MFAPSSLVVGVAVLVLWTTAVSVSVSGGSVWPAVNHDNENTRSLSIPGPKTVPRLLCSSPSPPDAYINAGMQAVLAPNRTLIIQYYDTNEFPKLAAYRDCVQLWSTYFGGTRYDARPNLQLSTDDSLVFVRAFNLLQSNSSLIAVSVKDGSTVWDSNVFSAQQQPFLLGVTPTQVLVQVISTDLGAPSVVGYDVKSGAQLSTSTFPGNQYFTTEGQIVLLASAAAGYGFDMLMFDAYGFPAYLLYAWSFPGGTSAGVVVWQQSLPSPFVSASAVIHSKTHKPYVMIQTDGPLLALDATTGNVSWTWYVYVSPCNMMDGRLYVMLMRSCDVMCVVMLRAVM